MMRNRTFAFLAVAVGASVESLERQVDLLQSLRLDLNDDKLDVTGPKVRRMSLCVRPYPSFTRRFGLQLLPPRDQAMG